MMSKKISWVAVGLAATMLLQPSFASVGQQASTGAPEMVGSLIVKYKTTAVAGKLMTATAAANLSASAGVTLTPLRAMSGNAQVVKLPSKMTLGQAQSVAQKIMADPNVLYAEPDRIMTIQAVPNDPQFTNQWSFFAPASAVGAANVLTAWNRTLGSASAVVAVIDTGILPHADLAGHVLPGFDFITDLTIANDGNGRDANPADPGDWTATSNSSWHGTHVAGTIGAATNNGLGVAGINRNARILPLRVLGKGGGATSDILDAIRWAAGMDVPSVPFNSNPAKVINMSLGGAGACSAAWQGAITDAIGMGVSVVVAAGNSNSDAANFTPASCAGVISVAANNRLGKKSYYSNFGGTVSIAAPGGDSTVDTQILSTLDSGTTTPLHNNAYAYYQGTSMASPHVAGIASLMYSVRPTLNPTTLKRLIRVTARPFPAGSTCNTGICGAGIIDASMAVNVAAGSPFAKTVGGATAINFGNVRIGQTASGLVPIKNEGLVNVTLGALTVPVGFTATGCAGLTLLPGRSCNMTIRFTPATVGTKTGVVRLASNSVRAIALNVQGTGFTAAAEVFPANGVMPVGWVAALGSNAAWRVATDQKMEGAFSLKSGVILDSQNSGIEVSKTVAAAGNVTFSRMVSSETNFDFLKFYIDGVLQTGASWSGAVPWAAVSYPVTAGSHTFKWVYSKDISVAVGSDAAWIDNVVLP